jgi:hypothetical protein
MGEPFVLDLESNPHPRMLAGAINAWENRDAHPEYWVGYLHAMADATGCAVEEIAGWVEHHAR